MELTTLSFKVSTDELVNAKKAVDELSKSIGSLNKVTSEDSKAAIAAAKAKEAEARANTALARQREIETKAALAAAKINESNIKVRLAEEAAARKVIEQLERKAASEERSAQAAEKAKQREIAAAEKAAEKQAAAARKIVEQLEKKAAAEEKARLAAEKAAASEASKISVLERQQNILNYMTQGYSKGQASVLAYAQANGAAKSEIEQLGNVLEVQRKLMGASPFDKSMSGLVALKNQYGEIREAIRQYNSDSGLTSNQTRELARDKERIIEKLKQEGAAFSQIKQAIREYNSAYTETANKVNILSKAEKDRERTMRDAVNASRNVQSAEERLFATVAHLNDGVSQNSKINERAALAIGSYERNLRLAGISGEEAAKKLMKYKAAQEQVSSAEAKNRASYISRGIGVQMGDVGVSLASGMNPLTVAIQQGDQIRGLIQQSGLEAAQMGAVMQQAFGGIVQSFKDVGVAIGSFVLGSLKSMGDGVLSAIGKVTGLNYTIGKFRDSALSAGPPTKAMALALSALDIAASVAGGAMAALLSALGLVGIAMYKSAKANDELLISITTSGAALGMTSKELAAFANANNIAGTSANDLKIALGELAAAGFKQRDSLAVITEAAQKYSQATGKGLNDVLKEYAKVAKEPVDSLIELGKATGLVSSATVLQVQAMTDAGDTAGATKLAMEAYAKAQTDAADNIEVSLSPLSATIRELKRQAVEAWDAVVEFANSNEIAQGIRDINSAVLLMVGAFGHASIVTSTFFSVWKNPLNAKEKISEAIEAIKTWDSVIEERNKKLQNPTASTATGKPANAGDQTRNTILENLRKNQQSTLSETEKYVKKMQGYMSDLGKLNHTDPEDIAIRKQINEQIKKESELLQESLDKKKKKNTEQIKLDNEYKRTLERISDLNIKNTGIVENLTKAEQFRLDIIKSDYWNKFTSTQQKIILNEIEKAKALEISTKALERQKQSEKDLASLRNEYQASTDAQLLEIQNRTANIGLLEEQKQVNEALLKIDQERISTLKKIEDQVNSMRKGGASEAEITQHRDTAISQLNKDQEERKRVVEQATRDSYQQQISFESGWDSAFANYLDAARNTAERGKRIFQGLADGMADAITQFAMTGKISMKDFANSFIAELIRMEAKTLATSFLGGAKGGISSFFSTAFSAVTGTPSTASYTIPSGGYEWAEGGYTGPGGVNEPAGIVHKGEVVWSQSDVAKAGGVGVVEGMRQGLRGYADGGLVGNRQALRQGDNSSSIVVNVSVASDGTSQVETSPQQAGPQLGNLIAAAVRTEIMKEKRNGGLLAGK